MLYRFNPLDRGNLNQILTTLRTQVESLFGFNPLDRGNLNQMRSMMEANGGQVGNNRFQSPRSGKFESNWTGLTSHLRWRLRRVSIP